MKEIAGIVSAAVLVAAFAATANAQAQDVQSEERPYWALQSGGGYVVGISAIANALENQYTVDGSGPVFNFGLARMHANGAPSFSLAFTRLAFSGTATGKDIPARFNGSGSLPGFLAMKYFSFVTRNRFSAGVGLGAGIGPQIKAQYSGTLDGVTVKRTYVLKELSVSPLFAATFRADFRVAKQLTAGPYAGLEDGLPVIGGTIRFGLRR
jgi:hypothetical protein